MALARNRSEFSEVEIDCGDCVGAVERVFATFVCSLHPFAMLLCQCRG